MKLSRGVNNTLLKGQQSTPMAIMHIDKPDKPVFMDEAAINEALDEMEQDELLRTGPVLMQDMGESARMVPFREKHLAYLRTHPKVNPANYLANVKTMIRIRIAN